MRKFILLMISMLLPYLAASDDLKPHVTVKLRDGSTAQARLDFIDENRVILFEANNQVKQFGRGQVLSINLGADHSAKFNEGEEGLVLRDGTVLKGHVVGIDETNFLYRPQGSAKVQGIERSRVVYVQFKKEGSRPPQPGMSKLVVVSSTDRWTDTGVDVQQGQKIWFKVSPQNFISCGLQGVRSNADGADPFTNDPNRPVPDAKACALIGKVGNQGQPFRIGLNTTPFHAQEDGRLLLGINDSDFRDNVGEFAVVAKTGAGETPEPGDPPEAQKLILRTILSVPATQPWTATDIRVRPGQRVVFSLSPENRISCGAQAPSVNAEGVDPFFYDKNRPLPDAKGCALIGKIGNGQPFKIGLNKTPFSFQENEKLILGINDQEFRDNSGEFVVFIVVYE